MFELLLSTPLNLPSKLEKSNLLFLLVLTMFPGHISSVPWAVICLFFPHTTYISGDIYTKVQIPQIQQHSCSPKPQIFHCLSFFDADYICIITFKRSISVIPFTQCFGEPQVLLSAITSSGFFPSWYFWSLFCCLPFLLLLCTWAFYPALLADSLHCGVKSPVL